MEPSQPASKYAALFEYLRRRPELAVHLTLNEVEKILGAPLPRSARTSRSFWSNRRGGLQSAAWLTAGFAVTQVDLRRKGVVFERRTSVPEVEWKPGKGRWDGEMVRALRQHLGLNQAGMADVLGVRQQTISEWENEMYVPSRSRSKHLDLVAERSGFGYRAVPETGAKESIDRNSDTV
ncbi:MAG TPA: helix-turn-helix domain-containing protein [Anaerolineales bacterium]|nr:helix-turn-helix domain-containing protein [Anaerolineales bacterium]